MFLSGKSICFDRLKLLLFMLRAAGPIVGLICRYYIMYETTIKVLVFIFDLEKSVVLFSHQTQPTHEFGGPGQAQN